MDERRVASTEQVRRYNLGLLLRLLHVSGAASRSDLVARTGADEVIAFSSTHDRFALARSDAALARVHLPR